VSPQWNAALSGFMQKMGFADFRINAGQVPSVHNIVIGDGRYVLDLEELAAARGIIMALFKPVRPPEVCEQVQRLLQACHYARFLPLAVHVALRGEDTLVLMTQVEQASEHSLSRAFDLMYAIYREAAP